MSFLELPPLPQFAPGKTLNSFSLFWLFFPEGHIKLCRTLLNQQHTKEASSHFQKFKQAAGVFA